MWEIMEDTWWSWIKASIDTRSGIKDLIEYFWKDNKNRTQKGLQNKLIFVEGKIDCFSHKNVIQKAWGSWCMTRSWCTKAIVTCKKSMVHKEAGYKIRIWLRQAL